MTQNLNQFELSPEIGDAFFSPYEGLPTFRLVKTSINTLTTGDFVKVVNGDSIGMVDCEKVAELTDSVNGTVIRSINQRTFKAGEEVTVACSGVYVWLMADAEINAGSDVMAVIGSAGHIITRTSTNTIVGIAMKHAAANELVPVKLV